MRNFSFFPRNCVLRWCFAVWRDAPAMKRRLSWVAASAPPEPAKPLLDRFGDALPEGALARFGTIRLRQGFLINRVLFSPDGKQLALAGCGRPVGLWDVETGKELQQFRKGNNQPSGI